MKIVLFGSGPFGIPTLEMLHGIQGDSELLEVVSRPDRPRSRGRKVAPTPLRARALELGLRCPAPDSANEPASLESLEALAPDLFVVVDYGEILRKRLRAIPRIGVFNLHASLLPAYRGAAPVAHAILQGETVTGVTLFRIERGLDTGPMVDAAELAMEPLESAGELEERLSHVAADLLARNLAAFSGGTFRETPQDESSATLAPKLEKSLGLIDWSAKATTLANLVRATNPWPLAWSHLVRPDGSAERTSFLRVRPVPSGGDPTLPPGAVESVDGPGFRVRCGEGSVDVLELQRQGKKALDAAAFLRGRQLRVGDAFRPAP